MAGAAVHVLHSTEDDTHGDGWRGACCTSDADSRSTPVRYGGGCAHYPGVTHGRRAVAGRGRVGYQIGGGRGGCILSPPLTVADVLP
jgi:hypothetical protein